jgi:glycosyltransferase involved in cell wall biosynthesis
VLEEEAGPEPVTIGFLHLGSDRGGIHRDGRMLAGQLREHPGVRVVECTVEVTGGGLAGLRMLVRAARALRVADVTIVPYGPNRLWASGGTHLLQLAVTLLALSRPVTILHDVYPPRRWRSRNWWALTTAGLLSRAVVFHEGHELGTLMAVPHRGRLSRIPLPVGAMSLPPRPDARAQFGLTESTVVVGMVGWIHPRKNCERAIEVLARLPEDSQLWLVGSTTPDAEAYRRELERLAEDLGVADRLTVTGYVDNDELLRRLAAVDVALVPYTAISASASLSTLIGARRPVVASDLAVTRELHELVPHAIQLADDPEAISELIASIVADPPDETAFAPILRVRSPQAVADRFERICREVAR